MKRAAIGLGVLMAMALATSSAIATTYDFVFIGQIYDLSGQLTATPYLGDSAMVTSLTGSSVGGGPSLTFSLIPPGWLAPNVPDNLIYPNDDGLGVAGSGFLDPAGVGMMLNLQGNPFAQVGFYNLNGSTEFFFDPGVALPDLGFFNLSAVPEPATWALMLVGLGSVGAGLRMRRQTSPQAA